MKAKEQKDLLQALEARFEKNMHRHVGIAWAEVRAKLEGNRRCTEVATRNGGHGR